MTISTTAPLKPLEPRYGLDSLRSAASAVSWGSIAAGAAAGASLSLILLILGVGLGLSSISPWARDGISAASFGVSTIIWLTVTQLLSSALGGYLAGRLRTKWMDTDTDEVFFRDTAHGFLAWAVALLATAALLTSIIGSILSGGIQAGTSLAAGDFSLSEKIAPKDVQAIGQLVAQHTGLSQRDAEIRATEIYARAQNELRNGDVVTKDTTDKARRASAYAALWIFASLLSGAFVASLAATYGGKQRDAFKANKELP